MNKRFFFLIKLLITAIALLYLSHQVDFKELYPLFLSLKIEYYILVFCIFLFNLLLSAYKWHLLLKEQGINIDYSKIAEVYLTGFAYNYLLPSSIGGDVYKTVYLTRKVKNAGWIEIATASFLDRFTGLGAILTILPFSLISISRIATMTSLQHHIVIAVVLMVVYLVSVFFRTYFFSLLHKLTVRYVSIETSVSNVETAIAHFAQNSPLMKKVVLISFLFQLLGMSAHYLLFISLGASDVPYFLVLTFIATTRIFDALPISFGGIGVREGILVLLGSQYGISSDVLIAYSLLAYTLPISFLFFFFTRQVIRNTFSLFKFS